MSWNGAGLFNRIHSWAADALNALNISSSRMDAEFDNFKGGLENCVTRNGENQASANLPMGTFKHTAVGTASARDQYGQVGQIQDTGYVWGGTAGGTANALTISVTPAITAYVAGQTFRFVTSAANTTAATLAVNGLSAQSIIKENGGALVAGDLPNATVIQVTYGGADFRLYRTTPLTSGAALTDVVHTTGAETVAGKKTFTSDMRISKATPAMELVDTAQAFPAGAWRWDTTANELRLLRNNSGDGSFASAFVPLKFSATDAGTITGTLTVSGTITSADATLTSHVVTKQQLDAKVYAGQIANAGSASVTYGPSGWTVSRTSTGITVVTHNLGTTSYGVTVSAVNNTTLATVAIATNTFTVTTITCTTAALLDTAYNFVLARN